MTPSKHQAKNAIIEGNFALLRAGELRLLFPLNDIKHTTHVDDDTHIFDNGSAIFNLEVNQGQFYLAISEQLVLLENPPEEERFILIQLKGLEAYWNWNEMDILTDQSLHIHPIPSNFLTDNSALNGLVVINNSPVFLCNAEHFLSYVFREQ